MRKVRRAMGYADFRKAHEIRERLWAKGTGGRGIANHVDVIVCDVGVKVDEFRYTQCTPLWRTQDWEPSSGNNGGGRGVKVGG